MPQPAASAEVVRRFWAARQAGDPVATRALLADDLTWQVIGHAHPVANTFHGPDGFLVELGTLLGSALVPGTRTLAIENMIVTADQVVTELHETATTRHGQALVLDIVTVMRVIDGRITECREYMDLTDVRTAIPADAVR